MQARLLAEKAINFSEGALNFQTAGRVVEQPNGLRIELNIGNELIKT